MNIVKHVPYLRHRWSTKSGMHFRCLRRGCNADNPREGIGVCRPWVWPRVNALLGFKPFTHGGGENIVFGRPRRTRALAAPKNISGEITVRATLENPKRRNRSARRKRRDRALYKMTKHRIRKMVDLAVAYGTGVQKFKESLTEMNLSMVQTNMALRRFRQKYDKIQEAGIL